MPEKSRTATLPSAEQRSGPKLPEFMKNPFYPRFMRIMSEAMNEMVIGEVLRRKFTDPDEWGEAHAFVQTVISELQRHRTSEGYMRRRTGPSSVPLDQAVRDIEKFERIERSLGNLLSGH